MQVNGSRKGKLLLLSAPKTTVTKVARTTTIVAVPRRRRKRQNIPRTLGNLSPFTSAYLKCLSDPFTNPPVKAGFGTMVGTQIHTAYLRGSTTTSSAGNLNMFVLPNPTSFVLINQATGVSSVPVGSVAALLSASNASVINQMANESRTLAMGLRIYPMIAGTVAPGIISLGCAPRCQVEDVVAATGLVAPTTDVLTNLFNKSTFAVAQMPYLREHIARPGGADFFQVTWRPTDIKDFEFSPSDIPVISYTNSASYQPFLQIAYGAGGNQQDTQGSFLAATFVALPASTPVYYEVVLHMEMTTSTDIIANTDFVGNQQGPSLASESGSPSFESLYRTIQPYLPSVDQVVGAASSLLASPLVRSAASSYAQRTLLGVNASGFERIQRF